MRKFNFISQLHSNNDKFYYLINLLPSSCGIICNCWNRILLYSKYNPCGNCTRSIAEEMHTFNAVNERHHHAHFSNAKQMMLTAPFIHSIEIYYAIVCTRISMRVLKWYFCPLCSSLLTEITTKLAYYYRMKFASFSFDMTLKCMNSFSQSTDQVRLKAFDKLLHFGDAF